MILASFWEAQGPPKIDKKSKKLHLGRFWNASKIVDRFGDGFGRVWEDFGRFWEGFGRTFKEIRDNFDSYLGGVEELTSMIRATRGRSIDR